MTDTRQLAVPARAVPATHKKTSAWAQMGWVLLHSQSQRYEAFIALWVLGWGLSLVLGRQTNQGLIVLPYLARAYPPAFWEGVSIGTATLMLTGLAYEWFWPRLVGLALAATFFGGLGTAMLVSGPVYQGVASSLVFTLFCLLSLRQMVLNRHPRAE